MHNDLIECGWTEEHWARICSTVSEEAQKARVAAQLLPVSGPEHPSTIAIPHFGLSDEATQYPPPARRLAVDSDPSLYITTIAINVELRTVEIAEPELRAALVKFRRAANLIARIEDALVFSGRPFRNAAPPFVGSRVLPQVYTVMGEGSVEGIFRPTGGRTLLRGTMPAPGFVPAAGGTSRGNAVVNGIIRAISALEGSGQIGPFSCALSMDLFEDVCEPNSSMVMPRDRILPFLQGPLLRSSAIPVANGAVLALGGSPIELVVANDIQIRYLQTTLEPRYVFRVSERVALRIKEPVAIALMSS